MRLGDRCHVVLLRLPRQARAVSGFYHEQDALVAELIADLDLEERSLDQAMGLFSRRSSASVVRTRAW